MESEVGRVRINMKQSAKGQWQLDVTSEFPTVAESVTNLELAINQAKDMALRNGLPMEDAK